MFTLLAETTALIREKEEWGFFFFFPFSIPENKEKKIENSEQA